MKTCAGIVLYNPDIDRFICNIEAVLPQVEMVYLIDNASDNIVDIEKAIGSYNRIELIKNGENYGIAKALNQLLQISNNSGFNWILTLDQDTVTPQNIVDSLKSRIINDKTMIVSAKVFDSDIELTKRFNEDYTYVDSCITSGSLTNVEAAIGIGGFEESYFIDCVDIEFCFRAKVNGFNIIQDNNTTISHHIGNMKMRRFLFWHIRFSNHTPQRYYYMARNSIACFWKYKKYGFSKSLIRYNIACLIVPAIYHKHRLKCIHDYFKGVKDSYRIIKLTTK